MEENVGFNDAFAHSVEIYPNPSNGSFTIKTNGADCDLEILDLHGKTIMVKNNLSSTQQIFIPEKGLYFVKIYTNNTMAIEKVMVK